MKLNVRQNWLWLWIAPAALSWLVLVTAGPSGPGAAWLQLTVLVASSCVCGFLLAMRSFGTVRQRLLGGLFFTGASLCVLANLAFMGCFLCPGYGGPKPAPTSPPVSSERSVRPAMDLRFPARDSLADGNMLNLTTYYSAPLPRSPDWTASTMRVLPPGTHEWEGIKFDVRGLILAPDSENGKPARIGVGQTCRGIAFLHGAYFLQTNTPSRLVIHFAGGHEETVPLVYGKDTAPSYVRANPAELNLAMTNAAVWAEGTSADAPPRPEFSFYMTKWINPYPTLMVTSIDFISPPEFATPFLAAITLLK